MSRDLDALASILITLTELERSSLLSPATRERVERLREQIEAEIRTIQESNTDPAIAS